MIFVKKTAAVLVAFMLLMAVSCVMDSNSSEDNSDTSSGSENKQTCVTPVISGTVSFTDSTSVTISCSTAGASIYYTTNGSTPSASSTAYTGAFTLNATATVKAIAIKEGYNNSTVVSKAFTKIETVIVSEDDSGVMLQGFTWSSAPRDDSTQQGKWYNIVTARADDIKGTFEYMWCPPPSDSNGDAPEGYAPKMLNILSNAYGTEAEQKAMINAIKPTKAIADIVINHRAGTTNWADFSNPSWTDDYYSICSDDECFSDDNSPIKGSSKHGAADTGEGYDSFRDIDHTNTAVQNGIISWMNDVLKAAGYVGWRYDYVKGYDAKYVGLYNKNTNAAFSVGEHWPTDGYNASNPSAWGNQFKTWIDKTEADNGQRSRLFDFTLKGALNTVFGYTSGSNTTNGSGNYSLLANSANLCISQPADVVTFVDNHDTGSTQGHWALKQDAIGAAYAMILTHPGYPCVSWNHYFTFAESGSISVTQNGILSDDTFIGDSTVAGTTNTLRQHIDKLIELRKSLGIAYNSTRVTRQADTTCYAAEVYGANGSLIVSIGGDYTGDTSDYEVFYSGTNFKIWTQSTKCATPVITIDVDGNVTISCGTSGAKIYYTTNGSDPTTSSTQYNESFSVNADTTVKAIAAAEGLENSRIISKYYAAPITLTVTVESWIWNDNAVVFAWTWGDSSAGAWISVTGSEETATVTVPGDTTGFNMARCPAGTTEPDWDITDDSTGRVYNKTDDVTIESGVTSYTTSWSAYNPT